MKEPYLLFQVTCRSDDHLLFEKRHVSTNARPQKSARDTKRRKTHKSKAFFVIQKILIFDSHRYAPPQGYPYYFYYICSGMVWKHYQWIQKLLTQI